MKNNTNNNNNNNNNTNNTNSTNNTNGLSRYRLKSRLNIPVVRPFMNSALLALIYIYIAAFLVPVSADIVVTMIKLHSTISSGLDVATRF